MPGPTGPYKVGDKIPMPGLGGQWRLNTEEMVALANAGYAAGKEGEYNSLPEARMIKGDLVCGHCDLRISTYTEDIRNARTVRGLDAYGDKKVIKIQGFYETDGYDDGDNPTFHCAKGHESRPPEDVELDFV